MTCTVHHPGLPPVIDCVGCAGRWDRSMVERAIADYSIHGIALATLQMAIAEIDRLYGYWVALSQTRAADLDKAAATYATMRAELEALRCNDLDAFHDGELSPERRAAFELHLATCAKCEVGLQDLLYVDMVASTSGGSNG